MTQFRICKSTYIDKYGNLGSEYYYIQCRKSFLGIKYWSDISNNEYNYRTHFDTYEDAYACCLKIDKGIKLDSWKEEVVSYV